MVSLLMLLTSISINADPPEAVFNFSSLTSPATTNSTEPHLAKTPGGSVILSWVSREDDQASLHYSELSENGWQPAHMVSSGSDWFLNYADFPSVQPITEELWAAHWLVKRPGGTYAYDVAISLSKDKGKSWSEPFTPHRDNTPTEHGFVSLFPLNGNLGALWLDGRNMTEGAHGGHADNDLGGMTLRAAAIQPDSQIADEYLVDDLICDCCQTDIAIGGDGPIAVYRDRSPAEIRDIYVSKMVDGQWLEGTAVGDDEWEINGCPVNGPAIDSSDSETVVAWFTSAKNIPHVRFARSEDGADTFSEPLNIDSGAPIGRVDVALLDSGITAISWMRVGEARNEELVMRLVSSSGEMGPIQLVAPEGKVQARGFPQMINLGDRLVFAWTDAAADQPMVQTAIAYIE